jgi:hypothetical protein
MKDLMLIRIVHLPDGHIWMLSICGDGVVSAFEECDVTVDTCCEEPLCSFRPADTLCRPSAGLCDVPFISDSFAVLLLIFLMEKVADYCSGLSGTCFDEKVGANVECRTSVGLCDPAEVCDGSTNACPSDSLFSNETVCRSSQGDCDVSEFFLSFSPILFSTITCFLKG